LRQKKGETNKRRKARCALPDRVTSTNHTQETRVFCVKANKQEGTHHQQPKNNNKKSITVISIIIMSTLSFGDLTMTSVSFPELKSLKPPPSLPTAEHLNNHHINEKGGSTSGSDSEHHHHKQQQSQQRSSNTKIGMPSPRKSVEFILHPPPPKRTKLDTAWSAKQVVDGKSRVALAHHFFSPSWRK